MCGGKNGDHNHPVSSKDNCAFCGLSTKNLPRAISCENFKEYQLLWNEQYLGNTKNVVLCIGKCCGRHYKDLLKLRERIKKEKEIAEKLKKEIAEQAKVAVKKRVREMEKPQVIDSSVVANLVILLFTISGACFGFGGFSFQEKLKNSGTFGTNFEAEHFRLIFKEYPHYKPFFTSSKLSNFCYKKKFFFSSFSSFF